MALVLKDRIKETSNTTGQGTLTLTGAVNGFRTFADIGNANTTYYCIADGNNFEVGIGTYTASGTTLARTTVLQTSAGNTTKISCTGNQKVFVTQPASKAAYLDASNELVVNNTPLSTIQQRWTKTASSNQTAFSGAADSSGPTLAVNSTSHVFLNGIFLKETTDYALSGGTTVTLTAGATLNDIVEVITFTPLSTAITGITSGKVPVFTSGVADNDFLKIDGTTVEGRSSSEVLSDIGGQASLTFGIANTNAVKVDSTSVADDEYARFTSSGLESRSTTEVRSDLNVADGANAYVHPNHSGEVTSTADGATVIANNIVDEANLKVSNDPTNGYFLSAQSGGAGGMTWAVPTDTNTTYSAGAGVDLSGTTFSHSDTSSQASVDGSGRTYIQDITLDTYGHVTGLATATETVTNINYGAGNGLALSNNNFSHADTSSQASVNGQGRAYIQDITLDTYGHVTGLATATETVTDTNTTYSAGSGLTLSGTSFSHSDTSSQGTSNNSGRTYIQDITLDTYGHVTGLATATETVTNTDTNTTYSAGTNLSLSGTTFSVNSNAGFGSPTATTQSSSDNSTKVATTAYVTTALSSVGGSKWEHVNTITAQTPTNTTKIRIIQSGIETGYWYKFYFNDLQFENGYNQKIYLQLYTQNSNTASSGQQTADSWVGKMSTESTWARTSTSSSDTPIITYDSRGGYNTTPGYTGEFNWFQATSTNDANGRFRFWGELHSANSGVHYKFHGGQQSNGSNKVQTIEFVSNNNRVIYGDVVVLRLVN